MANISGVQEDVKFCPKCKGDLVNVPRSEMKSKKKELEDKPTHTYRCLGECKTHFEINQHR
jgi:uncharacterized protein with PIN domain